MKLYHVTYHGRLPSIADHGLRPGERRSIGAAFYDRHRKGAIFLTEASGLSFWHERAEEWAHAQADNLIDEGYVPVVLRVPDPDCEYDEPGSRDAKHDAYRCLKAIDPKEIELWNGRAWVPVEDYDTLDPSDAADEEGFMVAFWDNALVPPEAFGRESNPRGKDIPLPATHTNPEPDLSYLLAGPGQTAQVGDELGEAVAEGIARFDSPHGSVRYVMYDDSEPIGALQAVVFPRGGAQVANVYVVPHARRRGVATELFRRAEHDLGQLRHSQHLSASGAAWREKLKRRLMQWKS